MGFIHHNFVTFGRPFIDDRNYPNNGRSDGLDRLSSSGNTLLSGKKRWQTGRVISITALLIVASITGVSANSSLHDPLDAVLSAHVIDGRVNYPGIASDRRFASYLGQLKQTQAVKLRRRESLVFWINAYNALAIQGILNGGSPSSFFGRLGYFNNTTYEVGGRQINLYDLERKVIIPMGEPRIHFAINCASLSCPKLQAGAYRVERLDAQLDQATRAFINAPNNNRFDTGKRIAYLSKIFDWYEDDFTKNGTVLEYVANYVSNPAVARSLRSGDWTIEYLDYDWSLNGIPPQG